MLTWLPMDVILEQARWRCCFASQIAGCGQMTTWDIGVHACGWVCADQFISLSHLGGAKCFSSQVSKTINFYVSIRKEDELSLAWEREAGKAIQPDCRHFTQYFQNCFSQVQKQFLISLLFPSQLTMAEMDIYPQAL